MTRQSCSISSISAASAWRVSPPANETDASSQNDATAAADAHRGSACRANACSEPSKPGSITNSTSFVEKAPSSFLAFFFAKEFVENFFRAATNRPSTPSMA